MLRRVERKNALKERKKEDNQVVVKAHLQQNRHSKDSKQVEKRRAKRISWIRRRKSCQKS